MILNLFNNLLTVVGSFGIIFCCLIIVLESIIPVIPLGLFIAINFIILGNLWGLLVSWLFTVIGCMVSFIIFRHGFKNWFNKNARSKKQIASIMKYIDKMTMPQLVLLLAIPFTPAFAVNIAAGLSQISRRKYFWALVQGKVFLVYFWGAIGTGLIESMTNPTILIKIFLLVAGAYLVSTFVNKRYNIE